MLHTHTHTHTHSIHTKHAHARSHTRHANTHAHRAFDHLFGFYNTPNRKGKVNGLTGNEFNNINTTNPSAGHVTVDNRSPYLNPCDPDHGTPGTSEKIFGARAAASGDFSNATMSGFIEHENNRGHSKQDFCGVLSSFTPERIPVITALAEEFAIMDRFFCSHPGPTWPNRMFTLSATSAGSTSTGTWYKDKPGQLFPQRTIFDQVAEANLTWRSYYNDTPW